ncbi:MAG: helix-turn-helix domain-containing protein [Lachnospiraceae bacterium]|nr:helix-turn-helix domain-containing protein [Lachnospiraceae bacterium]
MTIGQNIARYRKMAGLTQKELADKCNCATGTIQQYELEKRTPKIDKLSEIAKVHNIPIDYLFGDISIGLMTEADIMQLDYYFSQNDKIQGLQKLLLDNDCIITKKDSNYILQKRINGTYG